MSPRSHCSHLASVPCQLAASLRNGECRRSCDSRGGFDSDSDAQTEAEVASAVIAWESGGASSTHPPHEAPLHPAMHRGASRKKRQLLN